MQKHEKQKHDDNMLRSLKNLESYKIHAKDGDIGSVHSFLFNDQTWVVRYLVVDTGRWLPGRKVLISPFDIQDSVWKDKIMHLKLCMEDIENSPGIKENKPVYLIKQEEKSKEYPQDKIIPAIGTPVPTYVAVNEKNQINEIKEHIKKQRETTHLRSSLEVINYSIKAIDGEIGHLDDIIVDDHITWKIHYLVVYIGNWLKGKRVLMSPRWITAFSWDGKEVKIDLLKEKVEESPLFDPSEPVNREYESVLYDYYGKPKYWE
jgi:hypothetical protein